MNNRSNIFIDITVTDECNCKCTYCFEHNISTKCKNSIDEESKQIELLVNTCKLFDESKYEWLTVSFWGGEPLLNYDYMVRIIKATYAYKFVRYHIYSNGTLVDNYKQFLSIPEVISIVDRLHIQLSYDGEPHHTIKRGKNSHQIFTVADLLVKHNIPFDFKATLSFDMFKYLPEIWQSYQDLYEKYGDFVSYSPTLDTSYTLDDQLEEWKTALHKIIPLELQFIQKYKRPLWVHFAETEKRNCQLNNNIHVHNDGNIYICHGCAYKSDNKLLLLGYTSNINSYFDVLTEKYQCNILPEQCRVCGATYCSICHIIHLKPDQNPYTHWLDCRVNNINRCKYFKMFGFISKLLRYLSLKYIY